MRIEIAALASLTLLVAAVADAAPIELKGITPGASIASVRTTYPGFACKEQGPGAGECHYVHSVDGGIEALNTLGGANTRVWGVRYANDRIGAINVLLRSKDFDQVAAAFVEKYGKPTKRQTSKIQNRMGASFEQVELVWSIKSEVLSVVRFAGDLETMAVNLAGKEYVEREMSRHKTDAKKGAKDL